MAKITKDDFAQERRWRKFILAYDGELPKGCEKATLLAYCFAMADKGTVGKDCYASDSTIGKEIGISHRAVVSKYRKTAIGLGWFTPTRRTGRVWRLDIHIPIVAPSGTINDCRTQCGNQTGSIVALSGTLPSSSPTESYDASVRSGGMSDADRAAYDAMMDDMNSRPRSGKRARR